MRGTWTGILVLASLAAACGGGGGSSSCPGAQDITGLWSGNVLFDDVAQTNPGIVTAAITQTDCDLGGTWFLIFEDDKLNKSFVVSGSPPTSTDVRINLNQCLSFLNGTCEATNPCTFEVKATLVTPTEMNGTYATNDQCSFSESGGFDISFRGRLTPTPTTVPVVIRTETPAPTPTP
jgi:hypothetical protein